MQESGLQLLVVLIIILAVFHHAVRRHGALMSPCRRICCFVAAPVGLLLRCRGQVQSAEDRHPLTQGRRDAGRCDRTLSWNRSRCRRAAWSRRSRPAGLVVEGKAESVS